MHRLQHTLSTRVREAIEDADNYYALMIEAGENPNLDNLGYISHVTIETFRQLFGRPDMPHEELVGLLRRAGKDAWQLIENAHVRPQRPVRVPKPVQAPPVDNRWRTVMAECVITRANEN